MYRPMTLSMTTSRDTVFVGIPCYNRAAGLADTIRCLQQQTHENWTALICDNASPDPEVRTVAERACSRDSRLRYHRNTENIGAANNFLNAALAANQPFFMWASDDDLWEPQFIADNLQQLEKFPDAQMSFCTIDSINRSGHVIRTLDGFSRFNSTGNRRADVATFLEDPEIMGKASLIYGLFRTESLRSCIDSCWDDAGFHAHGGDVVFLFAFVCRYPIVAHDECHLHKRQETRKWSKVLRRHPRWYKVTRRGEFESYVERHRKVASTTDYGDLAEIILKRRHAERLFYTVPLLNRFVEKRRKDFLARVA